MSKETGQQGQSTTGNQDDNYEPDDVATRDIRDELKKIRKEYAQLLKDHAELASMVAQLASGKIDEPDSESFRNTREKIEKIQQKLGDIHERVSSGVHNRREEIEKLKDYIEGNPLTSVIAAFGIGYIVSRIMGLGGRG